MSWQGPNLAIRPFLNRRPLRRTVRTLWVLAVALTAWNVLSYLQAGAGTHARVAEIERLEAETAAASERLTTIERDLAATDLAEQNARARFLNQRIEERSFSWNQLLDDLAATLPDGVRLRSLAPRVVERGRGEAERGGDERAPVALTLKGEAEGDDELLEFVDRLYAAGAFREPNLRRESRDRGGLAFDLSVTYLPGTPR